MAAEPFVLNPSLDLARLRLEFREKGRVEIRDLLAPPGADELRRHLLGRDDWVLVLNAGDKVYEILRADVGELSEVQKRQMDAAIATAARSGFQFRYETIRVPDEAGERIRRGTLLDRFIAFLSSEPALEFLRSLTGCDGIAFADGQATAYSAGHFLTRHDDNVSGKNRKAAYVFGLAPAWMPEWGGLLMFHGEDGNIVETFTPAMGSLRLFAVPTLHSVSYVTPFAPEPRLSITGWLRGTGA